MLVVYLRDANTAISDSAIPHLNARGVGLPGDVNADGKIGPAEVIFILQKVAAVR